MPGVLLDTLHGKRGDRRPVWLMRQAGRYLPEYRALRAEKGGFLELVHDSEAATDVTLQPIRRFGFDGAILFSDILVVPHALGQDVRFAEGEGPRLDPVGSLRDLDRLAAALPLERLAPVFETLARLKTALPAETTLLGFCGAPWTVASYMIAGKGTPDQAPARTFAYRDPDQFAALIDRLVQASAIYLVRQLQAGAEAVQLFVTWAGVLGPQEFDRWCVQPAKKIVALVRRDVPEAKI